MLGAFAGVLIVIGFGSALFFWNGGSDDGIGEVEWSPLYASRERTALAPVTSQVAYGAMQSAAAPCSTTEYQTCDTCQGPTCDRTCDTCETCQGSTCEGTCEGQTCEATCYGGTCQATCDGRTCEGTCDEYTCEWTCEGCTCEGTCDEYTCEASCDGSTCEGWTCAETCDGYTCEETCEGSTCAEGGTCDGSTCPVPTCTGRTCVGPTCAGFRTCDTTCAPCDGPSTLDRTCEGPTCDGPSCGDRTCDPFDCGVPTIEGWTCDRPTCDGPTCDGPTCEGSTCLEVECGIWDFGDAPDRSIPGPESYLTKLRDDGARHLIDGVSYLGERVDEEVDGQPNDVAYGDDVRPWSVRDDEDGVWFPTSLIPGQQAILIVDASRDGFFHGWIDYDENGDWDAQEERLFEPSLALQEGFNWIAFEVPEDAAAPEVSFARFRFGTEEFLEPTGEARDGEVEDYREPICPAYDVWIMTDDIVYEQDEEVELNFYVGSVSQVEIIRHRPDGESTLLWAGTVESGRHDIRDHGGTVRAISLGTETVEMIATSVQGDCTTWVTTPYVIVAP